MTSATASVFLALGVYAACLWFLFVYAPRADAKEAALMQARQQREDEEQLSDAGIALTQGAFESRMPSNQAPIRAHLYRQLMAPAYATLVARHRYRPELRVQIKRDWLLYLAEVEREASWLDELEGRASRLQWVTLRPKVEGTAAVMNAIENAFAYAMGDAAMAELEQARAEHGAGVFYHGELINLTRHHDIRRTPAN